MITGKTRSGFEYSIDDELLDDFDFFESLCEIDNGQIGKVTTVITQLLGEEQKKKLKDHIRTEKGRVPASKMIEELMDIMATNNQGKNS